MNKTQENFDFIFGNIKLNENLSKNTTANSVNISEDSASAFVKELVDLKQLNTNIDIEELDIENLSQKIANCKTKQEVIKVLERYELTPIVSEKENFETDKNYIQVNNLDYKNNIIEVRNLIKSYKNGTLEEIILKNIDFNIIRSAITTIVGPSGSGKTTILNILSGLDGATSGKVEIDGKNIVGMNEEQLTNYRLEKLGFIFQSYNLIADLTVRENVQISADLNASSLDSDEILKLVGLEEAKDKYPYQLSGGMQQRVSIARALVKNPKVLVCDEPTGALDENTGKDVLCLLQDLCNKTKTTIILVTHNPGIKEMSHAVIEVKDGHIDKYYTQEKILSASDINWA